MAFFAFMDTGGFVALIFSSSLRSSVAERSLKQVYGEAPLPALDLHDGTALQPSSETYAQYLGQCDGELTWLF
jgi:hypothetical protein